MFTELFDLAQTTTLQLLISTTNDGEMKVMVVPTAKEGENPALSKPLILTATPAELDEKFVEILNGYKASRRSLADALAETQEYMAAAEQDAREKATKKTTAAKPTAAPSSEPAKPSDVVTSEAAHKDAVSEEEIELF